MARVFVQLIGCPHYQTTFALTMMTGYREKRANSGSARVRKTVFGYDYYCAVLNQITLIASFKVYAMNL